MRYQSHTQALKDILDQLPFDKRRTSIDGRLENYTTTFHDIYNAEQRELNKQLGIKNINYKKNEIQRRKH